MHVFLAIDHSISSNAAIEIIPRFGLSLASGLVYTDGRTTSTDRSVPGLRLAL